MKKIVLITGATSGFGEACAYKFASEGYDVIITGRRKERLDKLEELLSAQYGIRMLPLVLDVRDRKAVETSINTIPKDWQQISILINNAGLAVGRDNFDEASLDDWDIMVDTNLKGLAYVTKRRTTLSSENRKCTYLQYRLHLRQRSVRPGQYVLRY